MKETLYFTENLQADVYCKVRFVRKTFLCYGLKGNPQYLPLDLVVYSRTNMYLMLHTY